MKRRCALIPGLSALLAGCATPSNPVAVAPGPDRAAVLRATQAAAEQVRRCYRHPKVIRAARAISTTLVVRYAADGTLVGLPAVARQSGVTPDNAVQAGRMAEAASMAVLRCQPIQLPPELHARGWDEFELTFSPGGAA
ncbi:hypothetical protein SAMN06295912_11058 [Sphingomonas laterariae]|uniref:TonB family C-terminal domain-containing protein n=1 Tax=Edaphosphingomonas laterariae TaxID=861865 RepID=A0A239FVQ7_9SPHN|nr:hypothetical protein [Sphingomonas laterariae]SNS60855.1 hypothetical protein SAMN06295912_11058 [Sphingomonas laterariae]